MKRRTQLDVIRDVAEGKAEALASEVGEMMREKAQAESMLERLTQYVADYSAHADARHVATRTPHAMDNAHRFVARLCGALEQQRVHAARVAERTSYKMSLWMRARADLEALERLRSRRAALVEQRSRRHEQRETDSAALRGFLKTRPGASDGTGRHST